MEIWQAVFPGPVRVAHYNSLPDHDKEDIVPGDDSRDIKEGNETKKDPQVPFFLDVFAISNVGILVSYFSVGIVSRLSQAPVQYYLIDNLDASSQVFSAYTTLNRLPLSTKFLFGILSDGVPMLSYRRKPWLLVGWLGFAAVNLVLVAIVTPGINATTFLVFGFNCFLVLANVCTDTLSVERSNFETSSGRGNLQSLGFTFQSFGRVIGAVLATILYDNGTTWGFDIMQIFLLNALVPIVLMFGVFWGLVEIISTAEVPSFSEQFAEVWRVLQLRAVWRPMIFIYVYAMCQIPNAAWYNFLVWGLGFSSTDLSYLTISRTLLGFVGYLCFHLFLLNASWRGIYLGTTIAAVFFSLLQIALILRLNVPLGIPDVFLAVGNDTAIALMESLRSMPSVIMFVMLCPEGAEGTTFAVLTTLTSLAGTVASDLSTWLSELWDVSNDTLAAGDFSGLLKLSILIWFLQLLPMVLIGLLPDTREEHQKIVEEGVTSWWGGFFLAGTLVVSLVFTIGLNLVLLL